MFCLEFVLFYCFVLEGLFRFILFGFSMFVQAHHVSFRIVLFCCSVLLCLFGFVMFCSFPFLFCWRNQKCHLLN